MIDLQKRIDMAEQELRDSFDRQAAPMPAKRYLVFAGSHYYPTGGWDDFCGDADTLDDARTIAKDPSRVGYWWHIIDTETKSQVDCGDNTK